MWLGIDAGNSNLVLGLFGEGPRPLRTYRLSTHPLGTADELRARIHSVLALEGTPLDERLEILVASVVPAFNLIVREAFPHARLIDSSWRFSYRIGTENPAATGIDRLVNAEAAAREGRVPAILVDSGTTTTICALTEREFLGGAILPGIQTCRDTLAARAAQLFSVELLPPAQAIGRGTGSALQSGVVLGYASMIDGMIARFRKEMAPLRPRVIVTGGACKLLREICREIDEADPELTLKGMAYLHESASRR